MHKSSAFCGEGSFHIFQQHFNGTINIANQIVRNLNLKTENKKNFTPTAIDKIKNFVFKQFATRLCNQNHVQNNLPKDVFPTDS